MYGCTHRCSMYSKYNCAILQRFYKLPYELGKATKTFSNPTTGYATFKNTWAREKPLPSTGAEPCPVREPARAPRALPNNFYKILRKWFYPYKKITLQNTTD